MNSNLIKEIVLILVRWILKVGAGWFAAVGISTGAAEEVLVAVIMFLVGVIISLFQRKKDKEEMPAIK